MMIDLLLEHITFRHRPRLYSGAEKEAKSTDAQVMRLPEPMQRYLRYAGVVGKEPIHMVHLRQRGVMRLSPLVWFSATDRFSEGHGTMSIKLLSLIPLGNERGPEMDQSTLVRYLGEIAWFPTAWLSDAIEWETIDADSVKVTIHEPHVSAAAVLSVNEQGQPILFTADRYMEEHGRYRLTPWSVQSNEFREVGGMRIPTNFEVTWHLDSGDFTWLRGEITEIEYNQSGNVTKF